VRNNGTTVARRTAPEEANLQESACKLPGKPQGRLSQSEPRASPSAPLVSEPAVVQACSFDPVLRNSRVWDAHRETGLQGT